MIQLHTNIPCDFGGHLEYLRPWLPSLVCFWRVPTPSVRDSGSDWKGSSGAGRERAYIYPLQEVSLWVGLTKPHFAPHGICCWHLGFLCPLIICCSVISGPGWVSFPPGIVVLLIWQLQCNVLCKQGLCVFSASHTTLHLPNTLLAAPLKPFVNCQSFYIW